MSAIQGYDSVVINIDIGSFGSIDEVVGFDFLYCNFKAKTHLA